MVPKVEGPWDIHYVDRLLAQLEARAGIKRPILVHAILETALGAPEPLREIPVKPSRMIHFLDFSNEKMVAKAADIATKTDILLGNLEDAVPVDRKEAAREGLIRVGRDSPARASSCASSRST